MELYSYDPEVLRKAMARRQFDSYLLSRASHVCENTIRRMLNESVPRSMPPHRVQKITGQTAKQLCKQLSIEPSDLCPDLRIPPPEEKYEPPKIEFCYTSPGQRPLTGWNPRMDNARRRRIITEARAEEAGTEAGTEEVA